MAQIETVANLADQIADWLGIYGGCKGDGDTGCQWEENPSCRPFCCRQGFVSEMEDRIRAAVENEKKLNEVGLPTT